MQKFSWLVKPEPVDPSKVSVKRCADIVIVGAGQAGTMSARAAAEAGAKVIVLEQQSEEHQWILGVGEIGHINSKWQERFGLPKVDIDEFVDDWQKRTSNRSNQALIRTYARESGECFDWFIDSLTEEEKQSIHPMLTPPSPNFPKELNGYKAWPGTANMGIALQDKAVKACQEKAKALGAEFFFGARAQELIKDGDRVVGVVARLSDGTFVEARAEKGVILAAGDYSKNVEMCKDLLTESMDLIDEGDFTGHGWDGSGIQMGMLAGGRLEPRSHAAMGGNYVFPGFDIIGSCATLRVNKHGKRYSNEGFGTHVLAAIAGGRQPNGRLYGIFDSNIEDQLTYQAPNHAVFDYTQKGEYEKLRMRLAKAIESKDQEVMIKDKAGESRPLYCSDTIEGLAKAIFETKEDQANFVKTVARYNELCEKGKDEDYGKDAHLMYPIVKPPFFATATTKDSKHPRGQALKLLVTAGGLLIDENQQVLGEDFEPIAGLYATGNCSGCRFGTAYTTSLPGQSIGIAQTLGMHLGRYLAGL